MNNSIREQIILAVKSGFEGCLQSNGYNMDLGKNVKRGRIHVNESNLPAVGIFPGLEEQQKKASFGNMFMEMNVEGKIDVDEFNTVYDENYEPSQLMEFMLADMIECMLANQWVLPFTSGGTHIVDVGQTIIGETSGATAYICGVEVTSGSWAAGTAAGNLTVRRKVGDFEAETVKVGTNLNVATLAGTFTYTNAIDRITDGLASQIAYMAGGVEDYPADSERIIGVNAQFNIYYTMAVGNPYAQPA